VVGGRGLDRLRFTKPSDWLGQGVEWVNKLGL
jgi:hypothetical protein